MKALLDHLYRSPESFGGAHEENTPSHTESGQESSGAGKEFSAEESANYIESQKDIRSESELFTKVKGDVADVLKRAPKTVLDLARKGMHADVLNEAYQLEEFIYLRDKGELDKYKGGDAASKEVEQAADNAWSKWVSTNGAEGGDVDYNAADTGVVGIGASSEELERYLADPDKASAKAYLEKKEKNASLKAAQILYKELGRRLSPELETGYPAMLKTYPYLKEVSEYFKDYFANPEEYPTSAEKREDARKQETEEKAKDATRVEALENDLENTEKKADIESIAAKGIETSLEDTLKTLHPEAEKPLEQVTEEEFEQLMDRMVNLGKGAQLLHKDFSKESFHAGEELEFDKTALESLKAKAPKLYQVLSEHWYTFVPEEVVTLGKPFVLKYLIPWNVHRGKEDKKFYDNGREVSLEEVMECKVVAVKGASEPQKEEEKTEEE